MMRSFRHVAAVKAETAFDHYARDFGEQLVRGYSVKMRRAFFTIC